MNTMGMQSLPMKAEYFVHFSGISAFYKLQIEAIIRPIDLVPHQRMPDMLGMDANLVLSAGFGYYTGKRVAVFRQ